MDQAPTLLAPSWAATDRHCCAPAAMLTLRLVAVRPCHRVGDLYGPNPLPIGAVCVVRRSSRPANRRSRWHSMPTGTALELRCGEGRQHRCGSGRVDCPAPERGHGRVAVRVGRSDLQGVTSLPEPGDLVRRRYEAAAW